LILARSRTPKNIDAPALTTETIKAAMEIEIGSIFTSHQGNLDQASEVG